MKKTAGGICALLLLGVSLFSLRGGVLKAGELEEKNVQLSEQPVIATEPSQETVQEPSLLNTEEPPTSQAAEPAIEPPIDSSVEEVISEESTEATKESSDPSSNTSSETSETEATTSSSSESTGESTTSTTSNSTTESSTSSTTTQESTSSTESMTSEEPAYSTESSTSISTTEEQETSPSSSDPEVSSPEVPPAEPPMVQVPQPSQPTVQTPRLTNGTQDQALSATSTLNLPKEWRAERLAESDLGRFELPLLSTFERKEVAAWIYGAIQQVGQPQEKNLEAAEFFKELYQMFYGTNLVEDSQKFQKEELLIGTLLYQDQKLVGLYLGNDSYLTLADVEVTEEHAEAEKKKRRKKPKNQKNQRSQSRNVKQSSVC